MRTAKWAQHAVLGTRAFGSDPSVLRAVEEAMLEQATEEKGAGHRGRADEEARALLGAGETISASS